jgi:hypothetical protein
MPIKGLSDQRRFSRLGKIRLGEKKKNQRGTEYPSKIDYFKIDPYDQEMLPEIEALFGKKPRKLRIAFPDNEPERVFPQYYECWSASALHCKGDGEVAQRMDGKGKLFEVECPGPDECPFALKDHGVKTRDGVKPGCKRVARLQVVFPDLDSFGVFQLDTSSRNSIINVNSSIELVQRFTDGQIAWIPLSMQLKAQATIIPETGKKGTIYVVDIIPPVGLKDVHTLKPLIEYASENRIAQLEGPDESVPEDIIPQSRQLLSGPVEPDVDEEAGEILEDEPWPDLAEEPDVTAAFEKARHSPAKKAAMLKSAEAGGWTKEKLVALILKDAGGKEKAAPPPDHDEGPPPENDSNTLF